MCVFAPFCVVGHDVYDDFGVCVICLLDGVQGLCERVSGVHVYFVVCWSVRLYIFESLN